MREVLVGKTKHFVQYGWGDSGAKYRHVMAELNEFCESSGGHVEMRASGDCPFL